MLRAVDRPATNAFASARLVVAFLVFVLAYNEAYAYAWEVGDPWFLRYLLYAFVLTGVALGVVRTWRKDLPGMLGPPMAVVGVFVTIGGLGATTTCQLGLPPNCFTGYDPDPVLLAAGISLLFVGLFLDLGTSTGEG